MANLEAQRLLELAILDYLSKRGFHQIGEALSPEIHAHQNVFSINSLHEAFLQAWWGKFYEAFRSRFPDDPVFGVESFDEAAPTVENDVSNALPENNVSNALPANALPASSELSDAGSSTNCS